MDRRPMWWPDYGEGLMPPLAMASQKKNMRLAQGIGRLIISRSPANLGPRPWTAPIRLAHEPAGKQTLPAPTNHSLSPTAKVLIARLREQ